MMLEDRPPFDGIDLCVVSHAHTDHMSPRMAAELLKRNSGVAFISSPGACDSLRAAAGSDFGRIAGRVASVDPEWKKIEKMRKNGVDVAFFGVNHAPAGEKPYKTLATIFDFGGIRVVHLADEIVRENVENFKAVDLARDGIDIAFADVMFLADSVGQYVMKEYIKPAYIILMHSSPGELDDAARNLTPLYPNLIIFRESMEKKLFAVGRDTKIETGEIDGAPFRIQIPPGWNHNLVMYAHGYLARGDSWKPAGTSTSAIFLSRGFAFAESGYSRQGWAVEEGIAETEALRRYFSERHGRPDSAFVTGHSMGGLIALATIEKYPDSYDGALPMCGPLVPSLAFVGSRMFDMLVTFDALFGRSLPREYRPVVEAPSVSEEVVERALLSDSALACGCARRWDIRREDLPGILAFYHLIYREIAERAGGNPIDNRGTIYAGFGPMPGLNDSIRRYAAAPAALAYLEKNYTPTGAIEDPVLAVHTTYDPGVPPSLPSSYAATAALAGDDERFALFRVEADGHCNISPALAGQAFDRLRKWASTGIRPEPGTLR
jgi:pimeloyl-ACP methyl ester carboxylesterase/L-ascorbate metabolism protein UlaG (beta-lactamase superfamily)